MARDGLADKIRSLRAKHNLTLEQVANQVGVGKSTVRKWETGQIENMRRDKIAKLAMALHTTPAYLMGWEESPGIPSKPLDLESYTSIFIDRLAKTVENANPADLEACGLDKKEIDLIIEGRILLSFERACEISDSLGISLDDMLGKGEPTPESEDGLDKELIGSLRQLTPAEIQRVDDFVKGLLAAR